MTVGNYQPESYGEAFAEVYDAWYHDVTDAAATAKFVAARVGNGPVLELGIGTGRLAEPLLAQGLDVVGLDASPSMLAQARQRLATAIDSTGPSLTLVQADMAALPFRPTPGVGNQAHSHDAARFGAVVIGFNTLFNLPTAARQQTTITGIGPLLANDGVLVVEAMTGASLAASAGVSKSVAQRATAARTDGGTTMVRTEVDPDNQTIAGLHFDRDGRDKRIVRWFIRWSTPSEIDGFAADAGLELDERWADWHHTPFTDNSENHISTYIRSR